MLLTFISCDVVLAWCLAVFACCQLVLVVIRLAGSMYSQMISCYVSLLVQTLTAAWQNCQSMRKRLKGKASILLSEGCWFDSPGLHVEVSLGKILNPQTASDALVGTSHGNHHCRCMKVCMNYRELLWTKTSTKCKRNVISKHNVTMMCRVFCLQLTHVTPVSQYIWQILTARDWN